MKKTTLKKGLLVLKFWHLDNRWDVLWAAFCNSCYVLFFYFFLFVTLVKGQALLPLLLHYSKFALVSLMSESLQGHF